ncbi:MAG: four helix bundle protein [Bacteroidetes bacterium]|nr:four helix bundle protein [Bacteroidota bacterium]
MHQYPFEKLEIWELSVTITVKIYEITASFPSEEKFGIVSQIRRASNSVTANIAEGASRLSNKDKARFFQIAYSSLMEVLSFTIVCNRLGFLTLNELNDTRKLIEELSNKLNAYHKKLK